MANLEPAMEGALTGLTEKPLAELTLEMRRSAKQLYYLLVSTVRGKALILVRSAVRRLMHRSFPRTLTQTRVQWWQVQEEIGRAEQHRSSSAGG